MSFANMAASYDAEEYSKKEVVPNPLQHSLGPEVDARGIEAVESQEPSAPARNTAFWTRRRRIFAGLLGLCAVGAIVGGAIGGTVGKKPHQSPQSRYESHLCSWRISEMESELLSSVLISDGTNCQLVQH